MGRRSDPQQSAQIFKSLSKTLAHALRHAPWIYELELDREGWTPVTAVLDALQAKRKWGDLVEADLQYVVDHQDKRRYEMVNGQIRALYGHSLQAKILKEVATPPSLLYHGTSPEAAEVILREGLKPMGRQYVHLSVDVETAADVGGRKAERPLLLHVDAAKAAGSGVTFYRGNELVWLADEIPAEFIRRNTV